MDKIKYTPGTSGMGASMGPDDTPLDTGFTVMSQDKKMPWDEGYTRMDDDGTNYVGNRYEFRNVGACGRPDGTER